MMMGAALIAAPAVAQTQTQMNGEAGAAFAKADAAMAQVWKTTYARMKARDAADTSRGGGFGYAGALLESQRAWLKFRDTECVIEGGEFAGGSLQGMAMAQCKTRLTGERTAQLRKLEWRR
ncbi:hypothetical protein ASG11_14900 [Sphingomonas sp. Leaf357]|nr:hypothetical protein ASG11_14900 [Sphingomonas sp. Leaf357]